MKKALDALLAIWQLPQNIIGMVMAAIWPNPITKDVEMKNGTMSGVRFYMYPYNSVSLGDHRFIKQGSDEVVYRHETGHSIQSRILGPLYLIVIGIPSAIGNLVFRIPAVRSRFSYYKLPWEAWADRLAGIER